MAQKLRWLLIFVGALLFVIGLLTGQQAHRSRLDSYLRPSTVAPMDIAMLRVNLDLLRSYMPIDGISGLFEVPSIEYNSSCKCFMAHAIVTSELLKQPLDQVRATLMAAVEMARRSLRTEFPHSAPDAVPDRDFGMTFFELNLKDPSASHDIAEYVNGKILFK